MAAACTAAGIASSTAYRLRAEDADFANAWDEAKEEGTEVLEDKARRRAVDGWDEPVYYRGAVVGHVRKYDSTLLIFLLKARRPEVYRERWSVEHSSQIQKPTAGEPASARERGAIPSKEDALAALASLDAEHERRRAEEKGD